LIEMGLSGIRIDLQSLADHRVSLGVPTLLIHGQAKQTRRFENCTGPLQHFSVEALCLRKPSQSMKFNRVLALQLSRGSGEPPIL